MSLTDMYQLTDTTMSLQSASFMAYENLFAFTGSIDASIVGGEYRARLFSSGSSEPIWHGSLQVYSSQSLDKSDYEPQIPLENQYISHESTNEYKQYIIQ
jgi:hypothetical protein